MNRVAILIALLGPAMTGCRGQDEPFQIESTAAALAGGGFPVAIAIDGDDVTLAWSPTGESVSVFRAADARRLLEPTEGAGLERIVLAPGSTAYRDAGAASTRVETPDRFYRVAVGDSLSTMVMKVTRRLVPGYNKVGLCMLGGPSRASEAATLLGDAVVGVWGWDAATQAYLHHTPGDGASDFPLAPGAVFAAQVGGGESFYRSLVGVVPADRAFTASGSPGFHWRTIPALYDGPARASAWVDLRGTGVGRWDNVTQSAGYYWGPGDADFELEPCAPVYVYVPEPAKGTCNEPDPLACVDEDLGRVVPRTVRASLAGREDHHAPSCGPGAGDRSYGFTAPAAGLYQFDTLGTTAFDTLLAVYDSCGGREVACNDDAGVWPDEGNSVIVRRLEAGQRVVIVVDSYDGDAGDYTLHITAVEGYDCEANNPCTQENLDLGQTSFQSTIPGTFLQCFGTTACERINCADEERELGGAGWFCE